MYRNMVNFAWRPALLETAQWQLEDFLRQLSVCAALTCYLQAIANLHFGQLSPCNYLLLASCIVISWSHLGREVMALGVHGKLSTPFMSLLNFVGYQGSAGNRHPSHKPGDLLNQSGGSCAQGQVFYLEQATLLNQSCLSAPCA